MRDEDQTLKTKFWDWIDKHWTVPFHVAGVHPGTRVAVVGLDHKTVYLMKEAGEGGEVLVRIPRRLVGKQVFAPARFAGLKYDHDFYIIVQPWGLFRAIKQTSDYAYDEEGPAPQSELIERFIRGDADIQFAVRQVVNRPLYFWMLALLALLGLIAFLVKFVGISNNWALAIGLAFASIKAGAARYALGLARRAIHKS